MWVSSVGRAVSHEPGREIYHQGTFEPEQPSNHMLERELLTPFTACASSEVQAVEGGTGAVREGSHSGTGGHMHTSARTMVGHWYVSYDGGSLIRQPVHFSHDVGFKDICRAVGAMHICMHPFDKPLCRDADTCVHAPEPHARHLCTRSARNSNAQLY